MRSQFMSNPQSNTIGGTGNASPRLCAVMVAVESRRPQVGPEKASYSIESIAKGENSSDVDYLCYGGHSGTARNEVYLHREMYLLI